jgi:putative SOS response-associated peptidase YedK
MEIHKGGEDSFCFAGLWRPMAAGGEAFTLLTTEPSQMSRQFMIGRWSSWT